MNEKKIISINLIFILIMALSGLYFGYISNSKALLTDGAVSFVIFITSSIGLLIHTNLNHNNDYLYPLGKWRFEYIYDLIRLLIITLIVIYSLIEANLTIINYIFGNVETNILPFNLIAVYFPIKILAAVCSLFWLKLNKPNLDNEYYRVERDSVTIDVVLTIAILVGFTTLTQIAAIAPIADSITLLTISLILLFTIFSELKHLVYILIGKRIYTELEQQLIKCLKHECFYIYDVHIEKFGLIYIVFVTCGFEGTKTLEDLEQFELAIGNALLSNNITNYRIELSFKSP